MHRREGHLELGLDASDLHDPTAASLAGAVLEQGGLADARLTAQDQGGAFPTTSPLEHPIECFTLVGSPNECGRACDHATDSRPRRSPCHRDPRCLAT